MTIPFQILIVSLIILIIEFYSEAHLKNYGTFLERLKYLLGVKTLFNLFKLSSFISFVYVLLDTKKIGFNQTFLYNFIFSPNIDLWKWYIIPTTVITLLIILTSSQELFRQLRFQWVENNRLNQLFANMKYIVFRYISYALAYLIFIYTLRLVLIIHNFVIDRKMFFFDWIFIETQVVNNYDKGVYMSMMMTIFIFFLFNNSFIKKNSNMWDYRSIEWNFFKYFVISIFLCIGLFFGLFSLFNGIYNFINTGLAEWISKENLIGILPIRVASILIGFHLLSYIYKIVLDKRLLPFLVLGIFPIRNLKDYTSTIEFERRETLFFSQISFYILNISLAEFFIINDIKGGILGLLNFVILFIVDDFTIINDYSNGLSRVMSWHLVRIWIANIMMLIVSFIFLYQNQNYVFLGLYLLGAILLGRYYLKNASYIRFA